MTQIWTDTFSFPYYDNNPDAYWALTSSFYQFWLLDTSACVGWLHPWVVETMPWGEDKWIIDHDARRLRPSHPNEGCLDPDQIVAVQSSIIAETLAAARQGNMFGLQNGWGDELYPIYGSLFGPVSIERAGSGLFGILTFGINLTAYVEGKDGFKIWVPRIAKNESTYSGLLDNTVAGGLAFGEEPLEAIIREATGAASFSEDVVRQGIKAAGSLSYFYIQDAKAGEQSGLLQPSIRYVFDLKVDADVVPKPGDSEVEEFSLWALDDLKAAVAEGQFRPSSTLVLLDFFIRHGILTAENEKDYVEICSRIHRKLPFQASVEPSPAETIPEIKRITIPEAPPSVPTHPAWKSDGRPPRRGIRKPYQKYPSGHTSGYPRRGRNQRGRRGRGEGPPRSTRPPGRPEPEV